MKSILISGLLLLFSTIGFNQTCTTPGQNPETALPVCGSSVFDQQSVPICGQKLIPTNCPGMGVLFMDRNPFWYKFTCFKAGTLGFTISPKAADEDYDWQLFDVTNRKPSDVYTDKSLFVACNWSGEYGATGASPNGTSLMVCGGAPNPLYSAMPTLKEGHEYLLLISHFSNTQSGYLLKFGEGTAVINDTLKSKMTEATMQCDGRTLKIKLSRKLKCSSLAANGSDFELLTPGPAIVGAASTVCNSGFDMDEVTLTFATALQPGQYTIRSTTGTDGNTLLDFCNFPMATGLQQSFEVKPVQPPTLDSISPIGCAPTQLELHLKKPVLCKSIAADGSDFRLSGPAGIRVTSATAPCSNNITQTILLTLAAPIISQGNYRVELQVGSDGNTLQDECAQQTPIGSGIGFTTADTVSAAFQHTIAYGCTADTVRFHHQQANGINSWKWTFENNSTATIASPQFIYHSFGQKTVQLVVSNGVCNDTSTIQLLLDNELTASISGTELVCPNEVATFEDHSTGKITGYHWDFGNGQTSTLQKPPHQIYPPSSGSNKYKVVLTVRDSYDCADTTQLDITVLNNCFIAVPTAFTPNNDGLNDELYPTNAFKATNLVFRVYNRFGQLVFQSFDSNTKWNGTINNLPQPTGTYVWMLQYTHIDTKKPVFQKGTTILIR